MNAGISEEAASILYMHMEDIVECIQTLGAGVLMVKINQECAYEQIPVHLAITISLVSYGIGTLT